MKQIFNRLFLCAAILGLLCTGCGKQKEEEALTLHTVSMFGEGDSAALAYGDLIRSFQGLHQEITVDDASEVSSEQWKKGVLESFGNEETTPDVMFFFTGADVRSLILNGQLVSVEEIRKVYPDYGGKIRESTMAFMREFDGEHYALPVKGFWEGLFCNKDLFDRYGAPLPDDWVSFQQAVKIFSENGVIPVAASLNEVPHYWIEHLILAEGGAIEHSLKPKGYVPASWVKGIGWFKTLYDLSAFPPDTLTAGNASVTELFLDKKAAMILDGSWLLQSISDPDHTIVKAFPVAPGGKMHYGDIISGYSSGFYITRKAWEDPEKRDAAVTFVEYMTSSESITALCAMGGAPAVDIPQVGTDSILQESVNLLQQNAQNACMPIDSKLYKDAWQSLVNGIPDVAKGSSTARDVLERMSELNQWN